MLFERQSPRRVKPLLYVFRVLLSGEHLMRTGEVNANLPECNARLGRERMSWIDDLIARKIAGTERETLPERDYALHEEAYARARERLSRAAEGSGLPETATSGELLRDLLHRIRLDSPTDRALAPGSESR
jgi:predicted nucleotidyltransferase